MTSNSSGAALPTRTWRGGARIDHQNATFPFARLTASQDQLELRVGALIYRFTPDQVQAIEVIRAVPVVGKGVRIHHNVVGYPQLIVFWALGNPTQLSDDLRDYGYGSDAPDAAMHTSFASERFTCLVMGVILLCFLIGAVMSGSCIISSFI